MQAALPDILVINHRLDIREGIDVVGHTKNLQIIYPYAGITIVLCRINWGKMQLLTFEFLFSTI
jgi:hypothetical protein